MNPRYSLSALLILVTLACFAASFLTLAREEGFVGEPIVVNPRPYRAEPQRDQTSRMVHQPLSRNLLSIAREVERSLAHYELDVTISGFNTDLESQNFLSDHEAHGTVLGFEYDDETGAYIIEMRWTNHKADSVADRGFHVALKPDTDSDYILQIRSIDGQ